MKTKTNGLRDYLKANRRASREAEIGNHDRPVSFSRVHKSKKVYDPTILPTLSKNRG